MATRIILLSLIIFVRSFALSNDSFPSLLTNQPLESTSSSYVQYRSNDGDYQHRSTIVTYLHRQPIGSQLATIRFYRIVFHCSILPGSLYLRFSSLPPYRTVVQNRRDPYTIFGFRSVGAYSRIQIQHYRSGLWLCVNQRGRIITKLNITLNNLACTFRQNSDGLYMNLISELDSSRPIAFDLMFLLSMNRRLTQSLIDFKQTLPRHQRCSRFFFDSHINRALLYQDINL